MTHASMLAARRIRRAPLTRKALMMSCASVAFVAAALHPQSARAQAFQGTITSTLGGPVVRTTPTPTTETITVGSNRSTINWSPTNQAGSGTIDFLPAGNIATFTSTPGVTNYIVLNRIIPTDASRGISLNGHVISTLQGTSATGGQIWFYSPGGILIGSTAVIDVGSLVLTTNDLTNDSPLFATFTGPAGSASRIQVQNGAQINALQPGSYVAMIAPRIEQAGKVRVNGSAAYVAAEGATMSINQGLFDIQVDVGTTDPNGIVHTGETSGPANTAASDNHGIYMVAVPKNQALEMLLGGTVGFDNAVSAQVQNGQIILSAGYGTQGANFSQAYLGGSVSGRPADIRISGGNFTSSVTAGATGNIEANGGGGTLAFAGDVSLQGLESASLVAHDGDTITVGGNATVSADDLRTFTTSDSEVQIDAAAGNAAIQAQSGGSIQIAGSARVTANAGSAVNNASTSSGSTQGGDASISAPGGTIAIGGATFVSASGLGAVSSGPVAHGGDSFGGSASLTASSGGSLTVGGPLDIRADGLGSFTTVCCGGSGGFGEGGSAGISADSGGTVTVHGAALLSASGQGGAVVTSPDGSGGEGDGGNAYLDATSGGRISFGSGTQVIADGNGGNATFLGGDGYGGSSAAIIDGGSITAAGNLLLQTNGLGGTGLTGGDGYGGSSTATFFGGNLMVVGQAVLRANGTGGDGLANAEGPGGDGGDGYGGFASLGGFGFGDLVAEVPPKPANSIISLGSVVVDADADGGAGGSGTTGGAGGYAQAGDASIFLSATTMTSGNMQVRARGFGGDGGSGSAGIGGAGGDADGGTGELFVDADSGLNGTTYAAQTNAEGGAGGAGSSGRGDGGSAQSGDDSAFIDGSATFGGSSDAFTGFVVTSFAQGGAGDTAGSGSGGSSSINVNGSLNVAGLVQATARALGGAGITAGGSATGGSASVDASGHLATDSMLIGTSATGGSGNTGGDAVGGSGSLNVGGTLALSTLNMPSFATGGTGVVQGGQAQGGYAAIDVFGGSAQLSNQAVFNVDATGGNASNGTGGSALGGQVFVEAADGGSLTGGTLNATANATSGNGNNAGLAGGGHIDIISDDFGENSPTSIALDHINLAANGALGSGATDGETFGYGGSIALSAFGGSLHANSLSALANGSNFGGSIRLESDVEFGGGKGNLSFGALTGFANGADLGGFIFASAGSGSTIDLGNATLTAIGADSGQITLRAGSGCSCESEQLGQSALLPTGGGIAASNVTLNTSGNILMTLSGGADISVAGAINGDANGTISLLDDGTGGAIRAHLIDLNAFSIIGNADIFADIIRFTSRDDMSLGMLSATNSMDLDAGGDLTTGNLAGGTIELRSNGDMRFGNLTGDHTDFNAHGSVTGGDIHVTTRAEGSADGAVVLGNITAGPNVPAGNQFSVGIASGTSISVGNVTGAGHVGFATFGNLTTGNLTAGDLVMLLVGGDISTGSITTAGTGRVYLGDASMFALGGGGDGENGDFDPNVVLALTPVRTHGSITINGPVNTGKFQAAAGGNLTAGGIAALDALSLDAGGNIDAASLTSKDITANADGTLAVSSATGGTVKFASGGAMNIGNITATDLIALNSGGDLGAGNLSATNSLTLNSNGGINAGNLNSKSITANALANLVANDATGGAIRLTSSGRMNVGNFNAADLIALTSGGDLSTGNLSATNSLTLNSNGGINAGNLNSKSITANAVANLVTKDATGGAIRLASGGRMTVGNFNATDLIALTSGGDLGTGNLSATNSLSLDSKGDIVTGDLASNVVTVKAASDFTVKNVNAGTGATFTAGDLAKFVGTVRSPTITVTSGDIDIAEGASLGVQGITNLLTLNAVSHGLPILLGDGGAANPGVPGQYHLDEDGDTHAASVVINAVGATPGLNPDVRIFDATIGEGGNGPNSVTLNTPGSIFVEGDLRYLNATPSAALTLNAGHVLEINTDLGSIVITDSTGHLTGTLALNADNVWIGSGTLLHQLEADPNFAGRDAALAAPPATPTPDGFVRAGTITSRVLNTFFAQNSGTADLFAGIDTGAGGLSIASTGTTPATLIIYGRQTNADGSVITNSDFLNSVNLQGTGGFTNDSAVNGCTIGSVCGKPPVTPGIDMASILGPLDETNSPDDEDKKKDKDKGDQGDDGSSVDPSLRLINTTPVNLDHQIDEPVTSGGDVVIGGSASPY